MDRKKKENGDDVFDERSENPLQWYNGTMGGEE